MNPVSQNFFWDPVQGGPWHVRTSARTAAVRGEIIEEKKAALRDSVANRCRPRQLRRALGSRPMTAVDHQYRTANERRAAARDAYHTSVANGTPLTGAELGRQFNRTDRWGRYQIGQVRAEDNQTNGHRSHPTPGTRDTSGTTREPNPAIRDLTASNHTGTHPWLHPAEPASANDTHPVDAGQRRPWLDTLITLAVALVAAPASYGHLLEVASLAGEPLWLARAFPITVDGLVLAQFPDQAAAAGPIVSAWPPLALYGTHSLLHGSGTP